MKIKILGNGGAVNIGLPYNAFMVNDTLLVEAPPDIVHSLQRENIDLAKIATVYVSHFHGDHYFGLPFFLLMRYYMSLMKETGGTITVIGPQGVREKTLEICSLAVGADHPLVQWAGDKVAYAEITGADISIDESIILKPFPMYHLVPTWGFSLHENGEIMFSYFADTKWDDGLAEQIKLWPKVIITDLNGERSDPVKVHLSEEDIVNKALEYSGEKIVYYGTHLRYQKKSHYRHIRYVVPGQEIIL